MALEKVPPHNADAEMAVLGALLLSKDALDVVVQILRPYDFYKQANRLVYETVLTLSTEGVEVDVLTLANALQRTNQLEQAGGAAYLAQLSQSVPSSANAEYYAEIVKNEALRRHLIQVTQEISSQSYDNSIASRQLVEDAERRIFELSELRQTRQYKKASDLVSMAMERIIELAKTKNPITGVPSGFRDLDAMTSGFHPGEFIIIAARPSIGKTTFALNIAAFQAIHKNVPVGFFTLEMPDLDLIDRILASEARVDSNRLRTGFLKPADLNSLREAFDGLYEAPLFIDDTPNMKLLDLRAQARRMKSKSGIQILYVDYISLIGHENANLPRHEQVADISRSLKALARELQIPVVALSQLTRITEDKKVPSLADLRESGSLEQDADVVLFLHRQRKTEQDAKENANPNAIETELIIGKQRKGPVGTLRLVFLPMYTRFENFDSTHE
ncbi:MAG: replicative DNA helicase [Spirochaetales bacterium]|nr:replicative DNA helicase [Spirochaetales bacterium]